MREPWVCGHPVILIVLIVGISMQAFNNPISAYSLNRSSAPLLEPRASSTPTGVSQNLGTLKKSSYVRASGTVSKSQSALYTFAVPPDPVDVTQVEKRYLSFTLKDKSTGSLANKSINMKYRINFFDDNNNQFPLSAGGSFSKINVLNFGIDAVPPGSYSLKLQAKGPAPRQYVLLAKIKS